MDEHQLNLLAAAFAGEVGKLRLMNGLRWNLPGDMTYETRQFALAFNAVLAQLADHSRVGICEIQGNKQEWATKTGLSWGKWRQLFQKLGFGLRYSKLQPGADFALNFHPDGLPTREPLPKETEAANLMAETKKKVAEMIKAGEASDEQHPDSTPSTNGV